jgi:hypothetical protein
VINSYYLQQWFFVCSSHSASFVLSWDWCTLCLIFKIVWVFHKLLFPVAQKIYHLKVSCILAWTFVFLPHTTCTVCVYIHHKIGCCHFLTMANNSANFWFSLRSAPCTWFWIRKLNYFPGIVSPRRRSFVFFALLGCYTVLIGSYWHFRTTYWSHLQGQAIQEETTY